MKMKPITKMLLTLVAVGVLVYAGLNIFGNPIESQSVTYTETTEQEVQLHDVNIETELPINGIQAAVVEAGASGFNAFIINVDSQGRWEKVKYKWGTSFIIDQFNNDAEIINGIRNYISWFLDYGVSGNQIHFVISSGALKTENGRKLARAIESANYVVNKVTASQEGKYAFLSSVPRQYQNNSMSIDMGSGNTKITDKNTSCEAPGAKFHNLNINPNVAVNQVANCMEQLNNYSNCFIIGGVPYNMYKQHDSKDRYVKFENPSYYNKLKKDGVKNKNGLLLYNAIYNNFNGNIYMDSHANMAIGFLINLYKK